ncbi:hypothetical protein [Cupriavidus lacunae]|uniref:hypothetical protein n=1 Tax=Cupriavidus lacunae TaxID=2666307 RepID=UPI001FC9708B|nr:hypothetical protein [Cupriavidus lacunae]
MPDSGAPACSLCLFRHVCNGAGKDPRRPLALHPDRVEVRVLLVAVGSMRATQRLAMRRALPRSG